MTKIFFKCLKINQFDKRHKPKDSRNYWIPNSIDPKKSTVSHVVISLLKAKTKQKEKMKLSSQEQFEWEQFLIRNHWSQKEVTKTFFKCWKQRTISPGSYTKVKTLFKNKEGNQDILRWKKMKGICTQQTSVP